MAHLYILWVDVGLVHHLVWNEEFAGSNPVARTSCLTGVLDVKDEDYVRDTHEWGKFPPLSPL